MSQYAHFNAIERISTFNTPPDRVFTAEEYENLKVDPRVFFNAVRINGIWLEWDLFLRPRNIEVQPTDQVECWYSSSYANMKASNPGYVEDRSPQNPDGTITII